VTTEFGRSGRKNAALNGSVKRGECLKNCEWILSVTAAATTTTVEAATTTHAAVESTTAHATH
jgi:hypothetical protein